MRNRLAEVALRTVLLYAGTSALWILLSGKVLHALVSNPVTADWLEIYKGWAFVVVTAVLLYFELRRQMRRWEQEAAERKRVEDALQWFRTLMDQTSDGIMVVNLETGRFLDVNERTCHDLGYPRKEMLTLTFSEIDPMNSTAARMETVNKQLRETGSVTMEGIHRRKNGTTFPVELNLKLVKLDREYVVAVSRDITGRKAAERALRENEARLTTIFHHSPLGIVITRLEDGMILDANDAFTAIHGYTREQLISHTATELQLWARPAERDEMLKRLNEQGSCKDLEIHCRRQNGDTGDLLISVELIDLSGERCMLGMVRDITERKRAEEARRRLATAVEQAAENIVITDADGKIQYVNPAFETHTGYQRHEVIGRNPRFLKSGEHDTAFYQRLWGTLTRGEVWSGHLVNKKKDGTRLEEEATISPIRDATGKVVNYVAVKRDVTHEIVLESQLRQAQKMEAIGQLAGGVAHDFNNLLTAIHGNASLLLDPQIEPTDVRESSEEIIEACERAANLTRQLLMFSRKQVMQPASVDLNNVVTQMTKLLRRIVGEDIALSAHCNPDLPDIHADTGMLEQILLNLAVNSRDAMPNGGTLIITTGSGNLDADHAAQIPGATPGPYVSLTVADTGSGIAPEVQSRIFEPFFTTKEAGKGTGLGLATVYGIVRQHHGWINVASEVNRGTTFHICFPAATVARPREKTVRPLLPLPRGKETLLLVEDDISLRLLTSHLLQRCGYQVLHADSAAAALQIWREHPGKIQLLLTDMVMPGGISGRQLAQQISAENDRLPVIYTSGYSMEFTKNELALIEGQNFLQKPFSPLKLAQTVRRALDERQSAEPLGAADPAGHSNPNPARA